MAVSHRWRLLASDNAVWRALFRTHPGWHVNPRVAAARLALARRASSTASSHLGRTPTLSTHRDRDSLGQSLVQSGKLRRRRMSAALPSTSSMHTHAPLSLSQRLSIVSNESLQSQATKAPSSSLALDWQALYKTRAELDRRWLKAEPRVTKISGHDDR